MKRNKRGISLIVLVITIIVMIILAAAIILSLNNSGIINRAEEAVEKSNIAQIRQLASVEWGEAYVEGLRDPAEIEAYILEQLNEQGVDLSGVTITVDDNGVNVTGGAEAIQKGKIVKGSNATYTETIDGVKYTAVIPSGFCIVKDVEGDINNIPNGLVISDVAEDDLENNAHGNQFVWIPVENMENFKRVQGFYDGSRDYDRSMEQSEDESDDEWYMEAGGAGSEVTTEESIAMYASVSRNGGFYIARFEAGINQTDDDGNQIDNATYAGSDYDFEAGVLADGSVAPLSKKDFGVWNTIPWGGKYSEMEASDGFRGNDSAHGAVVVARSMSKLNSYSVTSTLCYGVQWDAVMNFIEPNYINVPQYDEDTGAYGKELVEEDSFVRNSSGKGNYYNEETGEESLALTGSNPNYQVNHIYDLGGNVSEWTMEAYYTYDRARRGASYYSEGSIAPASFRSDGDGVNECMDSLGFRVALYI